MTRFTPQDIIDERGQSLVDLKLAGSYMLLEKLGGTKSNYPDVDGLVKLRDGNFQYTHKYLLYQLKSEGGIRPNAYSVPHSLIQTLTSASVPTILLVADTQAAKLYWHFFRLFSPIVQESLRKKQSLAINLTEQEIHANLAEVCALWTKIAKGSSYLQQEESVAELLAKYEYDLTATIGVLYLLRRIRKDEWVKILNPVLGVKPDRLGIIASDLEQSGLLIDTINYFILQNEELGTRCLTESVPRIDLANVLSLCHLDIQPEMIFRTLVTIDNAIVHKFLRRHLESCKALVKDVTKPSESHKALECLLEYCWKFPKEALSVVRCALSTKIPKERQIKAKEYLLYGPRIFPVHIPIKAIEILERVHPMVPKDALRVLESAHRHPRESVRGRAEEAWERISSFDNRLLKHFGLEIHHSFLDELNEWSSKRLRRQSSIPIQICQTSFQSSFESRHMRDHRTVVISRGSLIPTPQAMDLRQKGVQLLLKTYGSSLPEDEKKEVIQCFQKALLSLPYYRTNEDLRQLCDDEQEATLGFLLGIVRTEKTEIVHEIDILRQRCLRHYQEDERFQELSQWLAENEDFGFWKAVVGFDTDVSGANEWRERQSQRQKTIQEMVRSISDESLSILVKRIKQVATGYREGRRGEFQYFVSFLQTLGKEKATIGRSLITKRILNHSDFLLPLAVGMWEGGERRYLEKKVREWSKRPKYMSLSADLLNRTEAYIPSLITVIEENAYGNQMTEPLTSLVQLCGRMHSRNPGAKRTFVRLVEKLTSLSSTEWISRLWFSGFEILSSLSLNDGRKVLKNMVLCQRLDYSEKDALLELAKARPNAILELVRLRIRRKRERQVDFGYEVVPHFIDRIGDFLFKDEDRVLEVLLSWCRSKDWYLASEGRELLSRLYPALGGKLERELLKLATIHKKENRDLVLSILAEYEGDQFLHNVGKAIILTWAGDEDTYSQLSDILSQTGTVIGEYGFATAFESKAKEMEEWKKDRKRAVREFGALHQRRMEKRAQQETLDADEEVKLSEKGIR